ncbi:hypothetical protein fugu_005409 [Takifugu bimaculatus]|uniref:DDE Tnp4 domain-containing protein n=1 Tax=Takifugu bimaculatus TaxID=433685 RepID=A0A4Z2B9Q1_9TELE|nr:hypothetical protein fugu_005409 [Takifugu bimaculatus]
MQKRPILLNPIKNVGISQALAFTIHRSQIINCVVRWPGSVHDSRILGESHIYHRFQQNTPDGILLGDSGYPLLRWLMTPIATVTSNSQQNFNYAHTSTRGTIERINGILKRRFACLNYLRVEPKEACNIICACIAQYSTKKMSAHGGRHSTSRRSDRGTTTTSN